MKKILTNPIYVFVILLLVINLPLLFFPINLFPGEIVYQVNLLESKVDAPLSLSYFIGFGYQEEDMIGVKDFYLKPVGYALVFCICIALPAILAMRVGSKKHSQK